MARIRGHDTGPEMAVRRHLHHLGYRYRLRYPLTGKPDLAFPRQRIAVFVHGCYWHRHGCGNTSTPKTRTDFWTAKFDRTVERDREVRAVLERRGWRVILLWECEIEADVSQATRELRSLLEQAKSDEPA